MTVTQVIQVGVEAVILVLLVTGPLLMAALVVGIMVGVFQAVTQINEMTLTFVPKIVAVFGILILLLPWMITKIVEFVYQLFSRIPEFIA
ncbi:flagellar biosynthesis protein FliQ [Chitinivibrio alkaliphilus]|uniref:Flagellar biosynthetic protein FliQ n=1 Tax=Chitinivibrio alkaliphilus ACht1 TaxID=1313304 RepID=U7DBD8_9BACT|nr:flagellar biosynthesis protein FliQ [Chitinivibrio alkaliphilus]ERP39327.1 flagellar biosynthetic protein FliQ [Chitinivibrio alkaliphilus ACht1]